MSNNDNLKRLLNQIVANTQAITNPSEIMPEPPKEEPTKVDTEYKVIPLPKLEEVTKQNT